MNTLNERHKAKVSAFKGNVVDSASQYVSDGTVMIDRAYIDRMRNAIDKRSTEFTRSRVNATAHDSASSIFTAAVNEAVDVPTFASPYYDTVDLPVTDYGLRRAPVVKPLKALVLNVSRPTVKAEYSVYVDVNIFAFIWYVTGATNVKVTAPDRPVVFFKGSVPVAVAMPLRSPEVN
jgi:hypothetical protein